ncbi:MAG: 30S ribosome-binding factor RbfA [Planctomycetota bacterium]
MSSRRQERVAQSLKQEISRILLFELKDPRMGFMTVTNVLVAGDLKSALVCVSVMGDAAAQALTLKGLRSATAFIQQSVGRRLGLRYTPALRFEADDSVKKSVHLSKVLREVVKESRDEETM